MFDSPADLRPYFASRYPTPKPWHGDPIDKPPMEYTPLPDPTPKLTAEEKMEFNKRRVRDAVERLKQHAAAIRAKAFEEAAEKAPELVRLIRNEGVFAGPYNSGYDTEDKAESVAVEVLADAIRALAKEQVDATETPS